MLRVEEGWATGGASSVARVGLTGGSSVGESVIVGVGVGGIGVAVGVGGGGFSVAVAVIKGVGLGISGEGNSVLGSALVSVSS